MQIKIAEIVHKSLLCPIAYHDAIWGNGGIAQHSLNFGTTWKGVISLTLWPLYPPGKEHVVLPFPRAVCFTSVYIVVLHCYTH